MRRLTHKRSRKSGLPPGTPVHIGERKAGAPRVSLMYYDGEQLVEEVQKQFEAKLKEFVSEDLYVEEEKETHEQENP